MGPGECAAVGPIDGRPPSDDEASRLKSSTLNAVRVRRCGRFRFMWPSAPFLSTKKRLKAVDFCEISARLCRDRTSARVAGFYAAATSKYVGSFPIGHRAFCRYASPGRSSCDVSFFDNADRLAAGPKTVMPPYAC